MLEKLFKKYKDIQWGARRGKESEPLCFDFILSKDHVGSKYGVERIKRECKAKKIPYRIWVWTGAKLTCEVNDNHISTDPKESPLFIVPFMPLADKSRRAKFLDGDGRFSGLFTGMSTCPSASLIHPTRIRHDKHGTISVSSTCNIEFVAYYASVKETLLDTYLIKRKNGNYHTDSVIQHHERSIRMKIFNKLDSYEDKIRRYKDDDKTEKGYQALFLFKHKIPGFNSKTRGLNRKANYKLAVYLDRQLERGKISDVFSDENIQATRKKVADKVFKNPKDRQNYLNSSISSTELKGIIKIAKDYIKHHKGETEEVRESPKKR